MALDPNSVVRLLPCEQDHIREIIMVLEASWGFRCSSSLSLIEQAGPFFFHE